MTARKPHRFQAYPKPPEFGWTEVIAGVSMAIAMYAVLVLVTLAGLA